MSTTIPDVLQPVAEFLRNTVLPTLSALCHTLLQYLSAMAAFLANALGSSRGAESLDRLLAFAAVCNFFVLWGSWSLGDMPTMGFGIGICALASAAHTVFVFLVVHRHPSLSRLLQSYSSAFLVGLMVGLTIAITLWSLAMAVYFSRVAKLCNAIAAANVDQQPGPSLAGDYECYSSHDFAMRSVSFFESMLFVAYGVLCGLLLVNGEEIGFSEWTSHQYENLDAPAGGIPTPSQMP